MFTVEEIHDSMLEDIAGRSTSDDRVDLQSPYYLFTRTAVVLGTGVQLPTHNDDYSADYGGDFDGGCTLFVDEPDVGDLCDDDRTIHSDDLDEDGEPYLRSFDEAADAQVQDAYVYTFDSDDKDADGRANPGIDRPPLRADEWSHTEILVQHDLPVHPFRRRLIRKPLTARTRGYKEAA